MANKKMHHLLVGEDNFEAIDQAARASIAPDYDSTATYAVGDKCMHEGQLYECTTAISTAEAWTAAHWTAVTVGEELTDLMAELSSQLDIGDYVINVTGTVTNGYYLDGSGGTTANTDYQVTDYISVKAGDVLIYTGVYGTSAQGTPTNYPIIWYSPDKSLHKVLLAPSQTGANRWLISNISVVVPSDGYIRAESAYNNSANPSYPKCSVSVSKIPVSDRLYQIKSTDMTSGVIMSNTGAKGENSNYICAEMIPVYPGQVIYYSGRLGGQSSLAAGIAGYGLDKAFVSAVFDNDIGGIIQDVQTEWYYKEITIPANVYYISVCSRNNYGYLANITLEKTYRKESQAMMEYIDADVIYRTIHQSDMNTGYIVQSNGVKAVNNDYIYIENIPVLPGQLIEMTAYFGGGADNSGGISGYDATGKFKQRVFDGPINGNPNTNRTNYYKKQITIPDGVFYIAFSTRTDGTYPVELCLFSMENPSIIADGAVNKHMGLSPSGTVFDAEIKSSIEAVQTVLAASNAPMLTMAVFTDLHHDPKYANDPTIDMMANIKAIYQILHFDALMNLGDAIDGQFQTQYQAEGCLSDVVTDMYAITDRSHNLIGNHDDNIQSTWETRGNYPATERLTLLEINDALFKGSLNEVHNPNHITDYYVDYDEYGIRVICIGVNYTSYVSATQTWLENTALDTDKAVLVYSHCATKPEWGYNNDISNGSYVESPLNAFIDNGGTVIAFIHGHTHGDMIETDASIEFTEVAIGCAKFEKLTSGTTGITYQDRDASNATKILFDIVCVDQTNKQVHFIRCGAGSDRYISYN